MNLKNKLVKETIWSLLTKMVSFILFLITNIYLTRKLGVSKFGEWSYFLSIITIFLTLAYLGINASSRVFIAKNKNTDKIKSVFRDAILLRTKVSAITAIIFLILIFPLSLWINKPHFFILFLIATPFILFKTFVEFFKEVFEGLHRIKFQFLINMSEFSLNLIFVIIGLNLIISIKPIIYAYAFSSAITAMLGFLFFMGFYKRFKENRKKSFEKKILVYSFPLILISVGFIIMTEIDTFMLGLLSTDIETGIYSAAKNIINKLPQIAFAISIGIMPIFAKLSYDNKKELKLKFKKLLLINSLIYIPLTILLIFGGNLIINILYGKEYINSLIPLQLLSLWTLMTSYNIFQSSFMDYQQKAWKRAINFTFSIILNVIFNLLLIPKYGAIGAAIGTTISYFPYFILNWIEVRRMLK